jgi:hypothetical protein
MFADVGACLMVTAYQELTLQDFMSQYHVNGIHNFLDWCCQLVKN